MRPTKTHLSKSLNPSSTPPLIDVLSGLGGVNLYEYAREYAYLNDALNPLRYGSLCYKIINYAKSEGRPMNRNENVLFREFLSYMITFFQKSNGGEEVMSRIVSHLLSLREKARADY